MLASSPGNAKRGPSRNLNHVLFIFELYITEPCIDYEKEVYKPDRISVVGLMIRARGTITTFYETFRHQFGFGFKLVVLILNFNYKRLSSVNSNHLYNQN